MATRGLPASSGLAVFVGTVGMVGGLALLFGYEVKWAAFGLALFTLFASLMFHRYWTASAEQQYAQQLLFSKNNAIVGALLFITAVGAGPWSLDGRSHGASQHRPRTQAG